MLAAVLSLEMVTARLSLTIESDHASEPIIVSWVSPQDGSLVRVGSIDPGKELTQTTFDGHEFELSASDGYVERRTVRKIRGGVKWTAPDHGRVRVECVVLKSGAAIRIDVYPTWSPLGAARFLDLVHSGFYDGVGLTRVVPKFLTQFGIASTRQQREKWRGVAAVPDDPPVGIGFREGYMSFAGSGPDSRGTEVFFVMPGAPQQQLEYFGVNPWETPFGVVADAASLSAVGDFHSYGDLPGMARNGHAGPDPGRIWTEGYEYLARDFPLLDYFSTCRVIGPTARNATPPRTKATASTAAVEL